MLQILKLENLGFQSIRFFDCLLLYVQRASELLLNCMLNLTLCLTRLTRLNHPERWIQCHIW
jgi:hypothetical protein